LIITALKITAHLDSNEFACKDGAAYPAAWVKSRLTSLCETIESIRSAAWDKPIIIVSGYRSPAYNAKIGGARSSQHMAGRAADIKIKGMTADTVHALVLTLYQEGKLLHLGGLGAYPTFTHVDVRDGGRLARWTGSRIDS